VEESDAQSLFETLFDIKAAVYRIHDAIFEPGDDEEEAEEDDA
jgi:hypothetical protein